MKTLMISAFTLALAGGLASPAFAGHRDLDQRRENQERRIVHGVESGELTRREAKRLWREQHEIDHLADKLWSDGRLSRREARLLDDRYDEASSRIFRMKHNERTARRSWDRRFASWYERRDGHRGSEHRVRRSDLWRDL